jgi:hypothetical protein
VNQEEYCVISVQSSQHEDDDGSVEVLNSKQISEESKKS